jgi:hypothetical protein
MTNRKKTMKTFSEIKRELYPVQELVVSLLSVVSILSE